MMNKFYINPIRRWFKERAFLLRLLFTMLLAGCIPLTIISGLFFQSKRAEISTAAQVQLASVAESVAGQFEGYQNSILVVNTKIQMNSALFGNYLASSVSNEIDALDVINYMKISMPYVCEYGFYVMGDSEAIYCTTGKYDPYIYASYVLGIDSQAFLELLTSSSKARYVEWDMLDGLMMYVVPVRVGSSTAVSRICFYLMSPATVTSSLSSVLTDQYHLATIYDPDGLLIYSEGGCPIDIAGTAGETGYAELEGSDGGSYLVQTATSPKGYRVIIYANKTTFQQNIDELASYTKVLVILNIFVSVMLIVFMVIFNYKSIKQVFRKINGYTRVSRNGETELQYIMNVFSDQVSENESLKLQLQEEHAMMIDRIMENLLNGKAVSDDDLRFINFDSPCYFVASTPIREGGEQIHKLIAQNSAERNFHAIEMYADGYITFICRCGEPSRTERITVVKEILEYLGNDPIRFGVSTAYNSLRKLFFAYSEAVRALNAHSEEKIVYADGLLSHDYDSDIDSISMAQLSYAIKTGDEYAIQYANDSFDHIENEKESLHMQQYACFQLLDFYRKAGKNVEIDMDVARISGILGQGNIISIRSEFMSILSELLRRQKEKNLNALEIKYSQVIQYINDNFTDPMFGVNAVAVKLGVTVYAAGRILGNLFGINFRKYLNERRIEYAKNLLLTTDLNIAEISEKAGYLSSSYFIRVFKSSEDMTPADYRKKSREK